MVTPLVNYGLYHLRGQRHAPYSQLVLLAKYSLSLYFPINFKSILKSGKHLQKHWTLADFAHCFSNTSYPATSQNEPSSWRREPPQVDQGVNAKVNIFLVCGICGKLSESILEMHVTTRFYTRSDRVHRFQFVQTVVCTDSRLWVLYHFRPLPLPFLAVELLKSWETMGSTGDSQGNFILMFLKLSFNWRITAFQCCAGFCHTTTWISHKDTYIPSLLNLLPTRLLAYPSRLSQSTGLSSLGHTATSH